MDADVNKKKCYKVKQKMSLQPLMYAVGETIDCIESYVVYYNDVRYWFKDPIEGFICLYTTIWILDLKYQSECYEIWQLVQIALFHMTNKNDEIGKVSSRVENLVSYLMKE